MNLDQFKNWALSQGSVCKHPSSGGGFCGECVSLVNQYCWRVLNVPAGAWGHAYAWGSDTNANVRTYFNKVSSIQAGDVIVYGTNFTPTYGHIGVALGGGQILDQNGRKPKEVAVGAIYNGYGTILRPKRQGGSVAKPTYEELEKDRNNYAEDWARLRYEAAGLTPTSEDRRLRLGLTWEQANNDLNRDLPKPTTIPISVLDEIIKVIESKRG